MKDIFANYRELLRKVDTLAEKIYNKYRSDIKCAKGCSSCCSKDLTFFPVEFFSITDYIQKSGTDKEKIRDIINSSSHDFCVFLRNNECVIYEARPVICRTFGLPAVAAGGNGAELQVCSHNYTRNDYGIDLDYAFNLDTLNKILSAVNMEFIKRSGFCESKNERFPLSVTVNYL